MYFIFHQFSSEYDNDNITDTCSISTHSRDEYQKVSPSCAVYFIFHQFSSEYDNDNITDTCKITTHCHCRGLTSVCKSKLRCVFHQFSSEYDNITDACSISTHSRDEHQLVSPSCAVSVCFINFYSNSNAFPQRPFTLHLHFNILCFESGIRSISDKKSLSFC